MQQAKSGKTYGIELGVTTAFNGDLRAVRPRADLEI